MSQTALVEALTAFDVERVRTLLAKSPALAQEEIRRRFRAFPDAWREPGHARPRWLDRQDMAVRKKDDVTAVVKRWPEFASAAGVPDDVAGRIRQAHRLAL